MLSNSVKAMIRTANASLFIRSIGTTGSSSNKINKCQSSLHHVINFRGNRYYPSIRIFFQTSSVKHYTSSSSKFDDSDDSISSPIFAKSNSNTNQPPINSSKTGTKRLRYWYLNQLLNSNIIDGIETAEKYLYSKKAESRAYQKVLDAWCKIQNFERAVFLLAQIHLNHTNKNCHIAPDQYQFTTVMYGYYQSLVREGTIGKHHKYATNVDSLFLKMIEWNEELGYETKPQSKTFEVLFQSMQYSDTPDPEKAETIFREMLKRYDDGDVTVKPTTSHIANILFLWELSNHEDAPKRSLALFTEAKNRSINLDNFCYTYIIQIQRKAGQYDTVENLYDEMITLFKSGDTSMKPSIKTMVNMLTARSRTGNPIGAQQVFTDMVKECKDGNWINKPTTQHFNLLLMAWYNSGRTDAHKKAHELVRKLNQMTANKSSGIPIRPDSASFAIVVKCYNRSNKPNAGKHVVDLYNEMKVENNVQPDLIFYYELLAVLMRLCSNYSNLNSDNIDAIIDTIKQILFKDVYKIPDSIWQQEQDGGGVSFCNHMIFLLQKHKIPDWEELSLHVESKLRPKAIVK